MGQHLTIYKLIGAKVAYYRKLNGYSQAELANCVHLNRSVIARIESGAYNNNIPLNLLFSLAEAMHIDAVVLITFDKNDRYFLTKLKQEMHKDHVAEETNIS